MKHKVRKRKKWPMIAGAVAVVIVLLVIANFIPTWDLKTRGMTKLTGDWVDVYYENEAKAAEDVFHLADSQAARIAQKLGFTQKQNIRIFIYDDQKTMQRKKYGLIAPLLGLDWYIGDNIGTDVIMTSPANPGPAHDYDDNKYAVLHEMVHAFVSVVNPHIRLWLTEGMALYLANGEPLNQSWLAQTQLPTWEDSKTKNPIKFSEMGGYNLAHIYIGYLEETYGWDKVLELIKTEDYEAIFGKSDQEIYNTWVASLQNNGSVS